MLRSKSELIDYEKRVGLNHQGGEMKKFAQLLSVWVIGLITMLFLVLFVVTLLLRYPNPFAAYALATSVTSEQPGLMPSHPIPAPLEKTAVPRASVFEALPSTIEFEGQTYDTSQLLADTATQALSVMRDGEVTYEWYSPEWSEARLMNGMSMGKTFLGVLVGKMIEQGKLAETDTVTQHLPEYADVAGLEQVTVQQLLDMQSCVNIEDDYPSGPEGWLSPISQMFATTDMDWVLSNNLSMACEAGGEEYEYRSVNSQLLGMIVARVSGQSLAELVAEYIWTPLGANHDASWSVDHPGGIEKSYCCLNASAIDFALFGTLFMDGSVQFGPNAATQVLSADWYERMTTTSEEWNGGYGTHKFGAHMWHKPNEQLVVQGYRGQFIWINRQTNSIVVKLSDDVENLYYDQVVAMLDQISFNR